VSQLLETPAAVLDFFSGKGEIPGNTFIWSTGIVVSYPGGMAPLSLIDDMGAEGLLSTSWESVPCAPMGERVPPIRHTGITPAGIIALGKLT